MLEPKRSNLSEVLLETSSQSLSSSVHEASCGAEGGQIVELADVLNFLANELVLDIADQSKTIELDLFLECQVIH